MPRIKTAAAPSTKRPKALKNSAPKSLRPKKKNKSVLVDVIEDELTDDQESEIQAVRKEELYRLTKENSDQPVRSKNFLEKTLTDVVPADLDNQKKFFSELASEIKIKKQPTDKEKKPILTHPSLGLYRRLVFKFIILVAILIGAVFYFSFSKLTVALTLRGEVINDTLLFKVSDPINQVSSTTKFLADQSGPVENIAGQIKEIKTEISKSYPATGADYLGEELVGQVKIINNYNKSQALVAKTRILSPDNKLFRLKNPVTVPAGGEVSVDIYVDKASEELAIGPTNFTIPGLWLGLQDKIYAQSEAPFVFSRKSKKYVSAEDIEQAARDISESLIKKAKEEAGLSLGTTTGWLYNTDEAATINIGARSGDKVDQFSVKASGKIIAVSFSKDQAAKLVAAKLNLVVPDDKELVEFKPEAITYNLENYDNSSRVATIKASFSGTMILKKDAAIINPEQMVNLNAAQINSYLKSQPEIKDFQLIFSPAFIKKAPSLVDRIKIEVNKN